MFYVVATPIGNLQDITLRALETLRTVDIVAAEDTRVIKKLLAHFDIQVQVISYREQVHERATKGIIAALENGKSIALVTDAGTPGISDPGSRLVDAVRKAGQEIQVIPGASAVIAALSISGKDISQFTFLGFPPAKKGREKFFSEIVDSELPVVIYESPHRLIKTLTNIDKSFEGKAHIQVFRELTKIFEEFTEGSPDELMSFFEGSEKVRGEFVLVVFPG